MPKLKDALRSLSFRLVKQGPIAFTIKLRLDGQNPLVLEELTVHLDRCIHAAQAAGRFGPAAAVSARCQCPPNPRDELCRCCNVPLL